MSAIVANRQPTLLPTQDDRQCPPSQTLFAPQPVRPSTITDRQPEVYQAPVQPIASSSISLLSSPIRRPPSRTEKKFKCTFAGCDKAYYKPSRLAEHELTHTGERPHTCPYCSQSYLRASHLTAHLRTHLSEEDRPFACDRPGCGKRFWTSTHLKRHQEVHDEVPTHKCEHCEMAFTKAHHLRDHVVLAHMPAGTKPYICDHPGCAASFALRNQLKAHEKTHDETRYTCSHDSHPTPPSFATWSALQAHMREVHAPTCPYRECHGRQFKSAQRLKDHLKVHAEREADLEVDLATQVVDDDVPDVILDGLPGGRRKRRRKSEAVKEVGALIKLRRLNDGSAGKTWFCEHEGCDRAFKTKFALASHVSASHLGEKFTCPREGCDKAFAHRSNLQRHLAGHDAPATPRSRSKSKEKDKEGLLDEITGASRFAKLKYGCPIRHFRASAPSTGRTALDGSVDDVQAVHPTREEELECRERYSRVYDVRRHLASEHEVVLTDMEVRMLLAKDRAGRVVDT